MKNFLASALTAISCRFQSRLGKAILSVLLASVTLRYPWIIGWLDTDLQQTVFSLCDTLKQTGIYIILFFVKGFNETGGSKALTDEAAKRVQQ